MHVAVYSRRHISSFEAIHLSPRHADACSDREAGTETNSQKFGDDIRDTCGKTRGETGEERSETFMKKESSRRRLEISSKTAASSNLYTRVARLIKRSQSKPKLIAAAARTACPGMGRAMREIRRNLGIGIGIAAVQVGHCTAVHRPDRRMRSERRRIGGAFQATIDPLYRQCGGRRRLHLPGGPSAARERSFCRDFAFRLTQPLPRMYIASSHARVFIRVSSLLD